MRTTRQRHEGLSQTAVSDISTQSANPEHEAPGREERHAGDIFHTAEERQRMEDLYAWGFLDLYRVRHPDEKAFSWWDYRGGAFHRGHGLRIDFLLGTQAVEKRVRSVTIDRDWRKKRGELKASDHCPVIADLD